MTKVTTDANAVLTRIRDISSQFAAERARRQKLRNLSRADFDALASTGYLGMSVPLEHGGTWQSPAHSLRHMCDCLRTLAGGDASVALVSAMHPAVLSSWFGTTTAPAPYNDAWQKQRREIFQDVLDGAWWGTITSEPGSGGDITKTVAVAEPIEGKPLQYKLSGAKHFGSGTGMVSYMVTTAMPGDDQAPDLFFLDVNDIKLDGSNGATLIAEWDGHGMIATQSHAVKFTAYPITRAAWQGDIQNILAAARMVPPALFTAVVFGVVETAFAEARRIMSRRGSLRPYEQVEWSQALMQEWLMRQAYEGMLADVERGVYTNALIAKTAVSELAESALSRLCKVLGGGSFSRQSPFGFWYQDVRALGFLRPPSALAYDLIYEEQSKL